MSRTNADAVAAIIEVDLQNIPDLSPFMDAAASIVEDVCTGDAYTEPKLELIERWLAAHFYAIRDPRTTNEQAKGVGASYQSKVDLGLNVTHYGQQAMMIDTQGKLAAWNKAVVSGGRTGVQLVWLGGYDGPNE